MEKILVIKLQALTLSMSSILTPICDFAVQALELLPSHTKVEDVLVFLENVLEERAGKRRSSQVLRSLLYAEHLQVRLQESLGGISLLLVEAVIIY